jgi:enamine deaminase RidA (YjgF/YER057c/UK114 family)
MASANSSVNFLFHRDANEKRVPLAAVAGDFVFYAGGMAAHPERGVPDGVRAFDGYPNHWSQINRELHYVYDVMADVHKKAGSDLQHLMKINSCHTHEEDVFEALRLRPEIFGKEPPPSTLVLAPELPVSGAKIVVDSIALKTQSAQPRRALVDSTANAPMPPHQKIWGSMIYSKATRGGGLIFTSGRTNNVIGGAADTLLRGHPDFPYQNDHAEVSCRAILEYLKDVLASHDADLSHVVKAEIHLNDMTQIAAIEKVWREEFKDDFPARIFIPSTFPTPYTTMEIEFIAVDPSGPWIKETIPLSCDDQSRFSEPYAVRVGPYVFFSGLSATDHINGLAPGAQVSDAFPFHESKIDKELAFIEKEMREKLGNITPLRCKFMSRDLRDLGTFMSGWERLFGSLPPLTAFRTDGQLPIPSTAFQLDLIGWIE